MSKQNIENQENMPALSGHRHFSPVILRVLPAIYFLRAFFSALVPPAPALSVKPVASIANKSAERFFCGVKFPTILLHVAS
ncbi:hypothetical protein M1E08_13720 [Erwinia sp. PK3-005]|uniref:Uncharacterized protein n=1 Tax=Mixta hanseatica TaxID=2872648 RepID=A0ABY4RBR5_9GAMM|nr:hypothetical protein [Mixta hanseatica]UQY45539.1 hypothetical protein K6958_07750 [Mixta hanseatica]